MESVRRLLPPLKSSLYKGCCGRLGVVGGSVEYTGAPYFAAAAILRTISFRIEAVVEGADLVHIFSPPGAAAVIKTYSPELIVHPSQDVASIIEQLPRLSGLLIGPGLGRSPEAVSLVQSLLGEISKTPIPTVVDADGLYAMTELYPSIPALLPTTILTPNAIELERLAMKVLGIHTLNKTQDEVISATSQLAMALKVAVFAKGEVDIICDAQGEHWKGSYEGSLRRPGGIGDILSGVLSVYLFWAVRKGDDVTEAARAASFLVRESARRTFERVGRGMVAGDVLLQVAEVIREIDSTKS